MSEATTTEPPAGSRLVRASLMTESAAMARKDTHHERLNKKVPPSVSEQLFTPQLVTAVQIPFKKDLLFTSFNQALADDFQW